MKQDRHIEMIDLTIFSMAGLYIDKLNNIVIRCTDDDRRYIYRNVCYVEVRYKFLSNSKI